LNVEKTCETLWTRYFEVFAKLLGAPRAPCALNGVELEDADQLRFRSFAGTVYAAWFGVVATEGRIRLAGTGCGRLAKVTRVARSPPCVPEAA